MAHGILSLNSAISTAEMTPKTTPERPSYGQKSAFVRANLLIILQMVKDGLSLKKMTEIIHEQAGEDISRQVISRNLSMLDLATMRLKVRSPGRPRLFLCNVGFGDGRPLHSSITSPQKNVTGQQRKYRFIDLNQALAGINPLELAANIAQNENNPSNDHKIIHEGNENPIAKPPEIIPNSGRQHPPAAHQDSAGKNPAGSDIMALFEAGAAPTGSLARILKTNSSGN